MVFSSAAFLFGFLPLVLLFVYPLPRRIQNYGLLLFSIIFYLWGAGSYIWVISSVAVVSWALGYAVKWWRERRFAAVGIALMLGVVMSPLAFYKYAPVVVSLIPGHGFEGSLFLPLGISFFTFHAISYLMDIYREDIEPTRLDHYLLYLFIFPHQIAGPIVRFREIAHEISDRVPASSSDVIYGLSRFGWGLAKKTVIADNTGALADSLFQNDYLLNGRTAWIAVLAYTVQIYFDFSAYSDMALGIARVFNFHFPENFAGPYRARSATEFWQRWHMTLSRWFRDYVYIPFGGNRKGKLREYAGLLLTFFLTSLWHGAFWHFLVWGGMWSALLLLERITGLRKIKGWGPPRRAFMIFFIIFSWVPFRAVDLEQTIQIWGLLVSRELGPLNPLALTALTPIAQGALLVGLSAFLVPQMVKGRVFDFLALRADGSVRLSLTAVVGLISIALGAVFSLYASFSPFLYYQF